MEENSNSTDILRKSVQTQTRMEEGLVLAYDYTKYSLERRGMTWNDCPTLPEEFTPLMKALRNLGDQFESNYAQETAELVLKAIDEKTINQEHFERILCNIFLEDENDRSQIQINWGRITVMFVFSGSLSARTMARGHLHLVSSIPEWTANFITTHLLPWIQLHGGWEGLIEFEQKKNKNLKEPRDILKQNLLSVAAGVGTFAVASFAAYKWVTT